MLKVLFTLAAIACAFATSTAATAATAQPPVHFESGSASVRNAPNVPAVQYKQNQKKKVWVPAHRSHGRLVKGHYIWR
jgi:hypothetical protein